jgi:hypothetical protein
LIEFAPPGQLNRSAAHRQKGIKGWLRIHLWSNLFERNSCASRIIVVLFTVVKARDVLSAELCRSALLWMLDDVPIKPARTNDA